MTIPDPADPVVGPSPSTAELSNPVFLPLGSVDHQRSAARGAVWTLIYVLSSIPLGILANIVVSRSLGPTGFGRVAVFVIVLGVASELSNLGYSASAIRWGSAAWARGDHDDFRSTLAKSLGWHLLVQAPVLAAVAVVLAGLSDVALMVPLVVGVVLPCIASSAALLLTMKSRTDRLAQFSLLNVTVVQTSTMTAAVLTGRPDVTWAATLVAGGVGSAVLFAALSTEERRVCVAVELPRRQPRGFNRFAVLSGANSVLQTLVATRSEVVILASLGYGAETGQFALAFGVAGMITAPVNALIGPLVPAAIGLLQTAPERAHEAYLRALSVSAMFSGIVLGVLVPAVALLLPFVYGGPYAESAGLLLALAACSCIVSVTNPALAFLNAFGVAGALVRRSVAALALNVALALALIPVLGLWGAAIANAAGALANCLPILALYQRHAGAGWAGARKALRPLVWSMVPFGMGCLVVMLRRDHASLWEPVALGCVLLAVWPLGLRLLRLRLPDEQRRLIVDALPGKRFSALQPALARLIDLVT
jgi:O-antigen/teichoic acid export membrane protein